MCGSDHRPFLHFKISFLLFLVLLLVRLVPLIASFCAPCAARRGRPVPLWCLLLSARLCGRALFLCSCVDACGLLGWPGRLPAWPNGHVAVAVCGCWLCVPVPLLDCFCRFAFAAASLQAASATASARTARTVNERTTSNRLSLTRRRRRRRTAEDESIAEVEQGRELIHPISLRPRDSDLTILRR